MRWLQRLLPSGNLLMKLYLTFKKAGMAKLADAADLKSAGPKGLWGFDSPSRHHRYFETALLRDMGTAVAHVTR